MGHRSARVAAPFRGEVTASLMLARRPRLALPSAVDALASPAFSEATSPSFCCSTASRELTFIGKQQHCERHLHPPPPHLLTDLLVQELRLSRLVEEAVADLLQLHQPSLQGHNQLKQIFKSSWSPFQGGTAAVGPVYLPLVLTQPRHGTLLFAKPCVTAVS